MKTGHIFDLKNKNFMKGEWAEGYKGVLLKDGKTEEFYSFTPHELATAKLRALRNKEDFAGVKRRGCLRLF